MYLYAPNFNQRRRLFDADGRAIVLPRAIRFADLAQQAHGNNGQHRRNDQQHPSDELMRREWIDEPEIHVQQKQSQDCFPCKETIKAVRAGRVHAKRIARDVNQTGGRDQKERWYQNAYAVIFLREIAIATRPRTPKAIVPAVE